MNNKKVGLSLMSLQSFLGIEEAIKFAGKIGADAVALDLCTNEWNCKNPDSIYSKREDEIVDYFSKIRKVADDAGVEFSYIHGRLSGFKNIPEEDELLLKNTKLDCLATKILGAPHCVVHAVTTLYMGPDCDPQIMRDLNFDMFCKILDIAKEYDVKIATETFGDASNYGVCDFFGNIEEFIKSFNRVRAVGNNKDYFDTCVDTGHSNKAMRFGNPTPGDVIRMLGDSVKQLHLNDNDTFTDQHKIPMTGTIDWNDVFDALDEINYNGIYNMEVVHTRFGENFQLEAAEFAVKVMRNMLKSRYGNEA